MEEFLRKRLRILADKWAETQVKIWEKQISSPSNFQNMYIKRIDKKPKIDFDTSSRGKTSLEREFERKYNKWPTEYELKQYLKWKKKKIRTMKKLSVEILNSAFIPQLF